MGRRHHSGHAPQRSRLVANRELNRALQAPSPRPFGIRRELDYTSQAILLEKFTEAQDDGAVSESILRRHSLHVTEVPLRKLKAQLSRGLVIRCEFGMAAAALESELQESFSGKVEAKIGQVAFFKRHALGVHLESEKLEAEYHTVRAAMGRLGLKGAMREPVPLHISLGDELRTNQISKREKHDAIEALEIMLPVGETVTLNPLEFYTDSSKQAA